MKKFILIICLFMIGQSVFGQECCFPVDQMQLFAFDKDFIKLHPNPKKYQHQSKNDARMVEFKTSDGKTAKGYWIEAKNKTNKTLLVFQEWWGLNEHIKREADKYYEALGNVNVLAVDLYDGKIAETRDEASKLMGGANPMRIEKIVEGAIDYCGEDAKIATIGWCFGGGWSLKASILAEKKGIGCVMYYGMPVKDIEQLKRLNSDVLGLFAGREKYINKEVVEEFAENMKKANKMLTYKIFDAEHAFSNPSNPYYDSRATQEAYGISIKYLKEHFKD